MKMIQAYLFILFVILYFNQKNVSNFILNEAGLQKNNFTTK
jgi:hypothetical protein